MAPKTLDLLLCFLAAAVSGAAADGPHWGYEGKHGPNHWASSFSICGGKRQSPINIETGSVKVEYWQPFSFKNYHVPANIMRVKNNGHTAKVEMDSKVAPVVRQGGLKGDYIFAQLHFHWGSDEVQGSEHTIDGVRYPLEMHLVHYKKSYGNLGEAIKHGDGLAVLGVMFEVGNTDNAALSPLINTLGNITDAGMVAELSSPYPLQAYLPDDTEKFYRYEGSLTTPTCNEAVVWTVFDDTVKVSKSQLEALRSLKDTDGNPIVNNYRPPTPLNNRKVKEIITSNCTSQLQDFQSQLDDFESQLEVLVSGVGSGSDSVSMKKMGLALYFMSTMTVIMMNM